MISPMDFTAPLLIIEAPGKIPAISEFCRGQGWHRCRIVATGGRLFDLPVDQLGIDLSSHRILERIACKPAALEHLHAQLAGADAVWIMTDPDDEGEWIANDAFEILRSLTDRQIPAYRTPLTALSRSGLLRSFELAERHSPGRQRAAEARRIFDREVGMLFSNHGKDPAPGEPPGSIGRVLTPALQLLRSNPPPKWHCVRPLPASDNQGPFEAVVAIGPRDAAEARAIASELADLPALTVGSAPGSKKAIRPGLWTGPEATTAISRELGLPVATVTNELQQLYQGGRITYPRTDTKWLEDDEIAELIGFAQALGERGASSASLAASRIKAQGGHGHSALIPTAAPEGLGVPLQALSREDQCLRLVWENTLQAARAGYHHITEDGLPVEDAARGHWSRWARQRDIHVALIRRHVVPGTGLHPRPNSWLNGKLGRYAGVKPTAGLSMMETPDDLRVADLLCEHRLGRPSTLSLHADKVQATYLDGNGSLNQRALNSLERARKLTPALMNVDTVHRLTEILLGASRANAPTRVSEALELAGLLPRSRDASRPMAQSLSDDQRPA